MSREVGRVLELYPDWENGVLPAGTSLEDQPATLVDAMRYLRVEVAECQEALRKRAESNSSLTV